MREPLAPIAEKLRSALTADQRDPALILGLAIVYGVDLLDELERLGRARRRDLYLRPHGRPRHCLSSSAQASPIGSERTKAIGLRVRLRCHGWLILRRSKLPMATWIIASETSRRCS